MSQKLKVIAPESGSAGDFSFFCPGCGLEHLVWTTTRNDNQAIWSFNGNLKRPTFAPSILVRFGQERVCHSFVTDGKIQYLQDCTHEIAGTTVDLPDTNQENE